MLKTPKTAEKTSLVGVSVKKMGNLLKDLGFKKDSSLTVQRAFFKHLIRAANSSSHQNPSSISEQKSPTAEKHDANEQMSFNPEILKAGNK
ncbi:MAG: hypothetical protein HC883_05890 [Bdellovibrionaceae bacterium]|nr:hypothetical protein [Pseudobdellovibrionaceae bacterium]